MTAKHLVFTYGSLKQGYHNSHYLKGAEFVSAATTVDRYLMFAGYGFPYVADSQKCRLYGHPTATARAALTDYVGKIEGELYLVDDTILTRLDNLEGHPRHYRRTPVEVFSKASAAQVEAMMYLVQQPMDPRQALVPKSGVLTWPNPYVIQEKRQAGDNLHYDWKDNPHFRVETQGTVEGFKQAALALRGETKAKRKNA